MPSGRPTSSPIPVNWRTSNINVKTVATFSHLSRREMYAYITRMNELKIGHFYMGRAATLDWDEEELLHTLMQPIDEITTASLFALERESNPATQGATQCRSFGEELGKELSFS